MGNPNFVNASAGDFHIKAGSKAVNAGKPNFNVPLDETDIDKQARKQSLRVDIGADESNLSSLISPETNYTVINILGLKAYPNPTKGILNVELPKPLMQKDDSMKHL